MEFIDLKQQQSYIRSEINSNIEKVLNHGKYILGPEVRELEEKLSEFIGAKHCIAVSSGTDALLISMMALGIKSGDEVITTPFTFVATVEIIKLLGAKPIYVDIERTTYNLDVSQLEGAITDKTKLILPVSLFGQCSDMNAINKIALKYGLPVLEDGAQSFGSTYNNKKSCGLSTIGCTSFFPSKPLGCYGDGGAIFTDNDDLAAKMKSIRIHGQDKRYHHTRLGVNGRLDTIQAAILLAKFEIFPNEILFRNKVANYYNKELQNRGCEIVTPSILGGNVSVYAQYAILTDKRDVMALTLKKSGIPTAIHYPVPIHKQPAYKNTNIALPVSEIVADKILCLPMHPYLNLHDQDKVINAISNSI
jgi:UDP-2-acetamido-2-deoxy-ribo-hexuluronate aminotransferase